MSNFRVAPSSWLTQRPATQSPTATLSDFQTQSLSQYPAAYREAGLPPTKSRESCGAEAVVFSAIAEVIGFLGNNFQKRFHPIALWLSPCLPREMKDQPRGTTYQAMHYNKAD